MKIVTVLFGLLVAASVGAMENMGAKNITLYGGASGEVPFPHHRHQTVLGDCNLCHGLFPQVSGSIEKLEAEGKLKKKQVMVQCQTCHRNRAAQGQKAGPVKCRDCHKN
jgi:cytochrome c-type protein NrfB